MVLRKLGGLTSSFKILDSTANSKSSRQTWQTQIRLLLKKQSDQVFHVCYSGKYFVNSSPDNTHLIPRQRKKVFKTFTVTKTYPVVLPVIVSAMVLRKLGGLMSSFKILDSTARGKPLSSISSSN